MTLASKVLLFFASTFAILALLMNVIVSKSVYENPLPKHVSKIKLYCIIWLIPFLGSIYVHYFIYKFLHNFAHIDSGDIPGWLHIGYKNDQDYDHD